MFPTQEVNLSDVMENENKVSQKGKSFNFDFSTGDFVVIDGKIQAIESIEALKMWIEKILRTKRLKFKIYNTENTEKYGISLLDLVNSDHPIDFIKAEIQREITETLLKNSEIKTVDTFVFNRVKRGLHVAFNVSSIYGTIEKEVTI